MSPWPCVVAFVSRVRDLCGRRRLVREAEQEIEMHLDLLTAQYVRVGNTPAEARRLARAKFGGVAQVRESLRDQAGFPVLESILHDVRYAARSLVRQPGTTALAVGILALGLGVNTAVLAVAYGVLWRPLPYPDADRLVTVARVYTENGSESGVSFDRFDEWNRRLRTMRVAGHNTRDRVVRGAGPTRVMEVASVTGNFFEVLGVPAVQGVVPRLAAEDGRAVISASLARALEDESSGSALGRTMTVGDRRYEVAAVMPARFGLPSASVDVWLAEPPVGPTGRGGYELVGRLREGSTLAQARDDATRVVRETIEYRPDLYSAAVWPLEEVLRGELRPVLRLSIAAALLVLVVACANAATLLIGRSVVRGREFAIRIALGSGLARLVRAALVEGLAMAAGGLVLGLAAAWAGLRLFAATAAGVMPRVDAVALDLPVLLVGLVLTLLAGATCGGASAAGAVRGDAAVLRGGTAATGSRITRRLRAGLVAVQIALSIVLLTGAGLLVRTVDRLLDEDAGFEPRQALTARLMLADRPLIGGDDHNAFVETLLERVRVMPGVQAAGVGSVLPPDDEPISIGFTYDIGDGSPTREIVLSFGAVTRGYFAALGARLRDGRRFEAAADVADPGPVMLSETAAQFVYPDEDAVGRPLYYGAIPALGIAQSAPIVAVVDDMKYQGLAAPRTGSIYVPWPRAPTGVSHLVVRTTGEPMALAPTVRDLIRTLNPSLPVPEVRTLEDHVAGSIVERRLRVLPAVGFAALALAVAMVGLFGALARAIAERRHELAIRAAVGASPVRLVRLVLRSALAVTGAGLVVGLLGAAATARGLASLLYGVGPYDPATFAEAAAAVVLAALTATAIPARRAARLDPMAVLRAD